TAECYEDGETLIGKAVGARRREFYLFTKCGHPRGWSRGDWRPASLLASIERSLKRLHTEYLDLIQLHSCELGDLETGDAIDALERAREGGLARYIGYSGDGAAARYAVECGRFDTLQTSISIADQEDGGLPRPPARARKVGGAGQRPRARAAGGYRRRPEADYAARCRRRRPPDYPSVRAAPPCGRGRGERPARSVPGVDVRRRRR